MFATSLHLHMKSSEVCIKTRSPPASLPIKDQVTKHTTVKWPIQSFVVILTFITDMTIFTGGISSSVTAGRAVLDTTALFKTKSLRRPKGKRIDQERLSLSI